MSTQVQRRKGTTAQHASFTGASAELTVDTTKNTVVVHDGATAGGIPLAKETGSALSVTSLVSSGAAIIEATDTAAALRITQLGSGNALLVEDSSNPDSSPFVIDTAGRVAIGHIATVAGTGPSSSTRPSLQVHGLSNSTSGAGVYNWSSTAALTSAVTFNRSLSNIVGTFGGAVTSSTSLGAISFSGDDGTSFYESVRILAQADGSATTGSTPGRLLFYTTPSGTTTPVERMRIGNSGDITIAGGTANGVTYLNASKVLTSGTALTFDGTGLGIGAASPFGKLNVANGAGKGFEFWPEIAASTNALFNFDRTGGTYQDFQVRAATHQWLIGASEAMRLTSTGLGIRTTSGGAPLVVKVATNANLAVQNASGHLQLQGINDAGNAFAQLDLAGSFISFSPASSEAGRFDASGNLLVGTTSAAGRLTVTPAAGSVGIAITQISSSRAIGIDQTNANTVAVDFLWYGSRIGSISNVNGTAITYNTSSDYRLKNITGPITTSGAYIDSLKPVEGTWKADGSTFVGLIAHETQEASRTTVATGTKDGDEMQGMDYSSAEIIANLIAELQSLRARVASLESK